MPNLYRYSSGENPAYDKTRDVVATLYEASRTEMPYNIVLIGY